MVGAAGGGSSGGTGASTDSEPLVSSVAPSALSVSVSRLSRPSRSRPSPADPGGKRIQGKKTEIEKIWQQLRLDLDLPCGLAIVNCTQIKLFSRLGWQFNCAQIKLFSRLGWQLNCAQIKLFSRLGWQLNCAQIRLFCRLGWQLTCAQIRLCHLDWQQPKKNFGLCFQQKYIPGVCMLSPFEAGMSSHRNTHAKWMLISNMYGCGHAKTKMKNQRKMSSP